MIHKFRFKNFFSFAEEMEVSFLLNRHAPDSDLVFESPSGTRLSKLLAVIGPNASGKTNVLKSIGFLDWFISKSFSTSSPEEKIPVRPHFFSGVEESELDIEFEVKGQLFRYFLTVNSDMVLQESLLHKTSRLFSYLFRRVWNSSTSSYEVSQKGFGISVKEAEKVRRNTSLISAAAQYNLPIALEIANYFGNSYSNVNYQGRFPMGVNSIYECANYFHNKPAFQSQMSKTLRNLDLGLDKITIESDKSLEIETGKDVEIQMPIGVHRHGNKVRKLPLLEESGGTLAAFMLLRKIIPALEYGGIVIIDELESDLHPDTVLAILRLFIDPETNPNNTQIIFSIHSHEVLNDLQKDQVLLVEKNTDGFSEAWRLGDMKGIRRDDNLYAKYRAGTYGAIPDILV